MSPTQHAMQAHADEVDSFRRQMEGLSPEEQDKVIRTAVDAVTAVKEVQPLLADGKPSKRKNWMRNRPCGCGSKKKFKVCCWSKYP